VILASSAAKTFIAARQKHKIDTLWFASRYQVSLSVMSKSSQVYLKILLVLNERVGRAGARAWLLQREWQAS
jgi:hypothetical protein